MNKKVITSDTTVNKDITMVVRLTPYLDNELTRISTEYNSTRSELVRVVLMNFVNEIANDEDEGRQV
jgi:metal-responsive CopG/Arc/MetJ family transcriptional regulator